MAGIEPRAVLRFLSLLIVCATVAFIAERTSSALRPPAHTWVAPDDRGEPQSRGMRALPPPPAVALPAGPLVFNAGPAEVTAVSRGEQRNERRTALYLLCKRSYRCMLSAAPLRCITNGRKRG